MFYRVFILTLFTLLSSHPAHAQELQRALVSDTPINFIDRLDKASRQSLISEIELKVRTPGQEFPTLVSLLCEIQPWTTGSPETDQTLQENLWRKAALEKAPWTDLFGALDCAAANRTEFYFSEVTAPIAQLHRSICSPKSASIDTIEQYETIGLAIKKVDEAILEGLTGISENTLKTRSFYPLRNVARRAMLKAAQGVRAAETDWATAQDHFHDASEILQEWNISKAGHPQKILLAKTRNGWRFNNDIEFFSKFYSWLAGDIASFPAQEFETWPSVKNDPGISGAFSETLAQKIPDDFIDYIFVERILPGAAPADLECERWRQRSYPTRPFAKHVGKCSADLTIDSLTALRALDSCIADFEASDWRIQFLAFRPSKNNWQVTAENEIKKIRAALSTSSIPLDDISTSLQADEGRWIRIMTQENLTTSRVNVVRKEISSILPDALFARPQLY